MVAIWDRPEVTCYPDAVVSVRSSRGTALYFQGSLAVTNCLVLGGHACPGLGTETPYGVVRILPDRARNPHKWNTRTAPLPVGRHSRSERSPGLKLPQR